MKKDVYLEALLMGARQGEVMGLLMGPRILESVVKQVPHLSVPVLAAFVAGAIVWDATR